MMKAKKKKNKRGLNLGRKIACWFFGKHCPATKNVFFLRFNNFFLGTFEAFSNFPANRPFFGRAKRNPGIYYENAISSYKKNRPGTQKFSSRVGPNPGPISPQKPEGANGKAPGKKIWPLSGGLTFYLIVFTFPGRGGRLSRKTTAFFVWNGARESLLGKKQRWGRKGPAQRDR